MDWPWRFLALITEIPPHAWDALVPRGRVHAGVVDRVGELVGRLPDSGIGAHPAVLGARTLQGLTTAVHVTDLLDEVDAWCETGWPRRFTEEPSSGHWEPTMVFAGAALAAARIADRRPEHSALFAEAAHRLARRAVGD